MVLRALALGFVLGMSVVMAPSCGGSTCNAMSCPAGCCDAMGRCQAGNVPSACGKAGETCATCAPGQACTLQICGGPMGVGGGSSGAGGGFSTAGGAAGGSAGGAAPMDAGCTVYGDIDVGEDISGEFSVGAPDSGLSDFSWWTASVGLEAPRSRVDVFQAELYFETADMPPRLPHAGTLPANTDFGNCYECFSASLGCDDNLENCTGDFLATSGSYSFTAATRSIDAGVFEGVGTNLTFRRWNFSSDQPQGTECFVVPEWRFRAVWPEAVVGPSDGGSDGGLTTDAGADAGADGG